MEIKFIGAARTVTGSMHYIKPKKRMNFFGQMLKL
jgi:hypothetical protein